MYNFVLLFVTRTLNQVIEHGFSSFFAIFDNFGKLMQCALHFEKSSKMAKKIEREKEEKPCSIYYSMALPKKLKTNIWF